MSWLEAIIPELAALRSEVGRLHHRFNTLEDLMTPGASALFEALGQLKAMVADVKTTVEASVAAQVAAIEAGDKQAFDDATAQVKDAVAGLAAIAHPVIQNAAGAGVQVANEHQDPSLMGVPPELKADAPAPAPVENPATAGTVTEPVAPSQDAPAAPVEETAAVTDEAATN